MGTYPSLELVPRPTDGIREMLDVAERWSPHLLPERPTHVHVGFHDEATFHRWFARIVPLAGPVSTTFRAAPFNPLFLTATGKPPAPAAPAPTRDEVDATAALLDVPGLSSWGVSFQKGPRLAYLPQEGTVEVRWTGEEFGLDGPVRPDAAPHGLVHWKGPARLTRAMAERWLSTVPSDAPGPSYEVAFVHPTGAEVPALERVVLPTFFGRYRTISIAWRGAPAPAQYASWDGCGDPRAFGYETNGILLGVPLGTDAARRAITAMVLAEATDFRMLRFACQLRDIWTQFHYGIRDGAPFARITSLEGRLRFDEYEPFREELSRLAERDTRLAWPPM